MALGPTANDISVLEVLGKFETNFAAVAEAVENGEFTLWVGSGVSRRAPSLGDLIDRAIEYIRVRAVQPATASVYLAALEEAIVLAGINFKDVEPYLNQAFVSWPQHAAIIDKLWNDYSRVLDIRVGGEPADFVLWEAIDVREAFSDPADPAAEHLCMAILVLEGAVSSIASANWDGFIEAAVARLSGVSSGVLQAVVDPNHLRRVAGRAKLLKFHGCIIHATEDADTFRRYLTGSRTQIMEWPENPLFGAMCNEILALATNQKTLVLGLSIQDNNLQSLFARAKVANPWPWPCAPSAPAHVFCENEIRQGQRDVLRIVYGDAYNANIAQIHESTHLRAWGEQVLLALVLKLVTSKLLQLMEVTLQAAAKPQNLIDALGAQLGHLRDYTASLAVGDRTAFTNLAIAVWSRLIRLHRMGLLPASEETYEVLSTTVPNLIAGDANAVSSGLGRLGVGLSLLQYGRSAAGWVLGTPTGPELTAGALAIRAGRSGAPQRPVFFVKSATEAIALQEAGAFANDNAVVIHGDNAWHVMQQNPYGARKVKKAPGRTGHVGTTHVSIGNLLSRFNDPGELNAAFLSEVML